MGLFKPVRYVLLSDGLLESMTPQQIEAVFGHEVGHIRHRHIQYFLLFAVCSMLILLGVVEGLRVATVRGLVDLSIFAMQATGFGLVMVVWGIGFGWISRRFERQADLFGVACVTPQDQLLCPIPCTVHDQSAVRPANDAGVCASAVAIFASALERVASLNGIPREERSWRHSSIANRVRFLISLTGDPARAVWFDRLVRRVKISLVSAAVVGSLITALYVWRHPIYGFGAMTANRQSSSSVRSAETTPAKVDPHARTNPGRPRHRGTYSRPNG
jgi:STE24 endopeptidase